MNPASRKSETERRHEETDEREDPEPEDAEEKDIVDEASEESFPASDPPSWTPTHI